MGARCPRCWVPVFLLFRPNQGKFFEVQPWLKSLCDSSKHAQSTQTLGTRPPLVFTILSSDKGLASSSPWPKANYVASLASTGRGGSRVAGWPHKSALNSTARYGSDNSRFLHNTTELCTTQQCRRCALPRALQTLGLSQGLHTNQTRKYVRIFSKQNRTIGSIKVKKYAHTLLGGCVRN